MKDVLRQAFERRQRYAETHRTLRLFDGAGDGMRQLFIDRYDTVALAHLLPEEGEAAENLAREVSSALTALAPILREMYSLSALYVRVHAHDPRKSVERGAQLVWGDPCNEVKVSENGLTFIVKPTASLHAGLYVDMRNVRRWLRAGNAAGKRVLNSFCFSGSLGIAAAAGGAPEVCQLDSSPSVLEWAKQNYELNRPSPEGVMKFMCDDCSTFLEREGRRIERGGKRTDIAIVDPPSFGRSRNRIFSFRKDAGKIVEAALRILTPHGFLIFTSNSRDTTPQKLEAIARESAKKVGYAIAEASPLLPPPEDFFATGADSIAMRGVLIRGG